MPAPRLVDGTRDQCYGEVLLAFSGPEGLRLEVYNSYLLSDMPRDLWDALDPVEIAREHGALAAVLNGPRYWTMDGIGKVDVAEPVLADFGGIKMRRAAIIALEGPMERRTYHPVTVNRGAVFYFDAGRPVFELVDHEGQRYVLQAYCVAVDPTLTFADLAGLGDRLQLPAGWRFETRVLDEELVIDTTGRPAAVVQDELENSYCRIS